MKNIAIILAGGSGTRVGFNIPKQFIKINNKPLLVYTLEIFQSNKNIEAIEIVVHKDWIQQTKEYCTKYNITKLKWICTGGLTFQESVLNGVMNLQHKISNNDIVVISFGVSPLTPQEDIDDSIKVCKKYGNGIAAANIDLSTCIKDDDYSTTQNIARESLKGFANPWTFKYGELYEAYKEACKKNMLNSLEPHTTSLYFALGKTLWFSQSTAAQYKITRQSDIDMFKGYLLLQNEKKATRK